MRDGNAVRMRLPPGFYPPPPLPGVTPARPRQLGSFLVGLWAQSLDYPRPERPRQRMCLAREAAQPSTHSTAIITTPQTSQSPRQEANHNAGTRISLTGHPGGLEGVSLLTMTPAHP